MENAIVEGYIYMHMTVTYGKFSKLFRISFICCHILLNVFVFYSDFSGSKAINSYPQKTFLCPDTHDFGWNSAGREAIRKFW